MDKSNCDCNCRLENEECSEKQVVECHGKIKEHPYDGNTMLYTAYESFNEPLKT